MRKSLPDPDLFEGFLLGYKLAFVKGKKSRNSLLNLVSHTCCQQLIAKVIMLCQSAFFILFIEKPIYMYIYYCMLPFKSIK